jgi:hypothetical protein
VESILGLSHLPCVRKVRRPVWQGRVIADLLGQTGHIYGSNPRLGQGDGR